MSCHDTMIIGPVSLDYNINYLGNKYNEIGGAVVQSGFAAAKTGHSTAIFTKLNPADANIESVFESSGADIFWEKSKKTTSIRNEYLTADKEKRECKAISVCDSFEIDDIPSLNTKIYHLAGLIYGDFSNELIQYLGKQEKKLALDVQCMLRHAQPNGEMVFRDWAGKRYTVNMVTGWKVKS